ncbi:MAG: efflux RND transporter permease subunit [Thermoguttaceae bacterium]
MKYTFYKVYGFWIIFVFVFLLSFIWMGARRTLQSNSNNVTDWLPSHFQETKDYQWFLKHFPYESFIVASWEGCTLDDPRLEMLAQKLVPGQRIDNMDEWSDESELTLSAEMVFADDVPAVDDVPPLAEQDSLQGNSLEKQPQSDSKVGSEQGGIGQRVAESVNTPTQEEEVGLKYFKTVLTGPRLIRMMKDRYSPSRQSPTYLSNAQILERLDGILIGPETVQGEDPNGVHRKTALIVTLTSGIKGKELRKVVAKIKELARECGIEPPLLVDNRTSVQRSWDDFRQVLWEFFNKRETSTAGIILGGPPIDNVAIDYEGERTLVRLAGICALIGLMIAWICLQSITLTFIVFGIAVLSAGISLAMVWLTGGHCDAILLSMPALVYVLTIAASIHIINYYFDAIREGGLDGAAERAIRHALFPCLASAITTVFGLCSLYMSNLVPIVKFGTYSALGVVCALALLFLLLPSLLEYFPAKKYAQKYAGKGLAAQKDGIIFKFWMTVGKFLIRHNTAVVIFCFVLMFVSFFGLFQIKTSVKMMRFFSSDSEIITHYTWLEEQLGPLVPMEVVIKFDNAQCDLKTVERMQFIEEICRKLRDDLPEEVGGVISSATFAPNLDSPTGKTGNKSLSGFLKKTVTERPLDSKRADMRDYLTVEKVSFDRSDYAGRENEFQELLGKMGLTISEAARLCSAGITNQEALLYRTEGVTVQGFSPNELARLRESVNDWQQKYGVDLWRISMRVWALKKDDIDYAKFINSVKGVVQPMTEAKEADRKVHSKEAITSIYTGMVPVVYKTQHTMLIGLTESIYLAFTTIWLVIALILRSPTGGFLTMIPNVFPIFLVFGIIGYFGILVDVGMMMTASIALGMAVDDTIHFLTWYRDAMRRGATREEATLDAYEKCAEAMSETTWVCGFGLSAFAFSTFAPTQMFGIMMLVLLLAALFAALIFLPALVSGPAGKFFAREKWGT